MITVPNQSDIEIVKGFDSILGIPVRATPNTGTPLWGRISGVHPQFAENDLLEALASQGVVKVVREKYTAKAASSTGPIKVERPTQRLRLLFADNIAASVTIACGPFRVTLCPATPLQCLSCCKFGHRAASCPKRGALRCRRCGGEGHEMWACEKKACCINCRGAHPANHHSCPVYATYAQAASER